MSILSTLRSISSFSSPVKPSLDGHEGHLSTSPSPSLDDEETHGSLPFTVKPSLSLLSEGTLYTIDHTDISCNGHCHDEFNGPIQDGGNEASWYCGNCGDGPMGTWITSCIACSHVRDTCCVVEKN
ncbi:hypothetical protein P280DRAFT_522238 [Massarina eburnea CBS 473.64]|uniref:Uncharacterized protein n=1 Tax=Massarina eburnea CBS 473.64 TaxID=1395130 RepID=A0A6A6RM43_9PLEO|nr:hypothetical protein P280DRAFT_522238 [Massarina eburnea CBS 473.64]